MAARGSLFFSLCLLSACASDPLRERKLAELGDETPGIPVGPLHRAGQPCGVCHGPEGPADSDFALSGTLYETPRALSPLVENATIRFIDWTGRQYRTTSNVAGNFFVRREDYDPIWPLWVKIERSDKMVEMRSAVFRETSCGTCHADPASPSTVGHIYLTEESSLRRTPQ
jgi:hypothetical protein